MRKTSYAIIGLLLASHSLLGQCRADVRGKVVNEQGNPVAGAQVNFPRKGARGILALGYYQTDDSGAFHAILSLTAPGSYWVLAQKIDSGYPDMNLAFYDDHKPPLVALHCGSRVSGIVVKLGSKTAYITEIEVLDATTGNQIKDASITFQRVNPPFHAFSPKVFSISRSAYLQKSQPGSGALPIPSNTDISYEISAPGYVAPNPQIIRLAPSKTATISVRLEKTSPGSAPSQ